MWFRSQPSHVHIPVFSNRRWFNAIFTVKYVESKKRQWMKTGEQLQQFSQPTSPRMQLKRISFCGCSAHAGYELWEKFSLLRHTRFMWKTSTCIDKKNKSSRKCHPRISSFTRLAQFLRNSIMFKYFVNCYVNVKRDELVRNWIIHRYKIEFWSIAFGM